MYAVDHTLGGEGKASMAEKHDPHRNGGSEQSAWSLQRAGFVVTS